MGRKAVSVIDSVGRRDLQQFDPGQTHKVVPALEAAIDLAARMRDWDALLEAVDWMIDEQREFVAWWKATVRGDGRPKKNVPSTRDVLSMREAEKRTKILNQQVSRWKTGLARPDYRARLVNPSYRKGLADAAQNRADLQTGEMEWFTPALYIEKARRVLGQFDLDPASCAAAQETVQSSRFFTVDDDGLVQDWCGTVWLNPPYAGKLVAAFAAKMLDQIDCGNVTAAIMLTNAYTETSWFHNLTNASNALCFTRGRIKFESPHGEKCAPTNGQSFFYFGNNRKVFVAEFADVGAILVRP